ncbi:MAG: hypothetical protein KatS3mg108_1873 [Isosphaeraceae bacterium]|jgi:hypothetical protein|nr:MAG: hypothetical protein KatS3mg108_1873 [Isosphaeraceae bacterium]
MTNSAGLQFRLTTLMAAVACVAVNVWLFRLGPLWGILGLNVTKHVFIAALCKTLGVDGQSAVSASGVATAVGARTTPTA